MSHAAPQPLRDALRAVTERTRLITRGVVQANQNSKPIGYRQAELQASIDQTRALLDELMLHQVQLGWKRGDAA